MIDTTRNTVGQNKPTQHWTHHQIEIHNSSLIKLAVQRKSSYQVRTVRSGKYQSVSGLYHIMFWGGRGRAVSVLYQSEEFVSTPYRQFWGPLKSGEFRSVSSLYHIILGGGLRLAKKRRVSVRIGSVSPHFLRGRKESRITAVSCCIVLFVTHPKNLLVSETKKSPPQGPVSCTNASWVSVRITAASKCIEVYRRADLIQFDTDLIQHDTKPLIHVSAVSVVSYFCPLRKKKIDDTWSIHDWYRIDTINDTLWYMMLHRVAVWQGTVPNLTGKCPFPLFAAESPAVG